MHAVLCEAQGMLVIDVAFDADPVDLDAPGPRHRIWLTGLPWRYELEGL